MGEVYNLAAKLLEISVVIKFSMREEWLQLLPINY